MTEFTSGAILEERCEETAENLNEKDVKNLIEKVNTTLWSLIHSLFPVQKLMGYALMT